MDIRQMHWGVLLFLVLVSSVLVAQHLLPPPRARNRRMTGVNASPKWVLTFPLTNSANTNTDAVAPNAR